MKYLDLIPELEDKFPELKGKFSFRLNTMGGGCRIYVNLDNHEIINYLDIRLYNDTALLAIPKTFFNSNTTSLFKSTHISFGIR